MMALIKSAPSLLGEGDRDAKRRGGGGHRASGGYAAAPLRQPLRVCHLPEQAQGGSR